MVITQAIILCGGLGTRLGSMVKDTPKPMLLVGGKSILEHVIKHLKKHGITRVILGAGYKAEVVSEFFSQMDWGMDIEVFIEKERLGTAGALKQMADKLDDEFLLCYGDVFIDYDVRAQLRNHEEHHPLVTFLTGPSTHPWDSNLIQTNKEGNVTAFVNGKEGGPWFNIGDRAVYVVSKKVLDCVADGEKADLMKQIYPKLLADGGEFRVHPIAAGDFVRDMGKPERFKIVEKYLKDRSAIADARAHPGSVTTVFLDRDGVLNKEVNLLKHPDELEILDGVPQAMKMFNDKGIKTVLVTNQPVIARGLATEDTLTEIHAKLANEILPGKLDAIYYCVHHPETRWGDGVSELRKGCDCRKPANGMIMQARDDLNIDLKGAVMIGDSFRDIEAGKNAGLRTIFIDSGHGAIKENMQPDKTYPSLLEAAKAIIEGDV